MKRTAALFLLALLLCCSATSVPAQQEYGTINGIVTGSNGAPVADAKVTADSVCLVPCVMRKALDQTQTDPQGRYLFKRLRYGRYAMSAEKAEDNYPPLRLSLYSVEKNPEIELSESSRDVTVDIHLTKKAGVLEGTVADEETGTPIDANVELKGTTDPQRFLSGIGLTNPRFRVLVPSDTPVFMRVSKKGYSDWSYSRNGQVVPLQLKPDETLTLEIKLKRVSSDLTPQR